jgi:trk system potassium uptake protein
LAHRVRSLDAVTRFGFRGGLDRSPPHEARPLYQSAAVFNIIGRLTLALGASMLVPALLDAADGDPNWLGMTIAGLLTISGGAALALLTASQGGGGLTRHQAFLLTVLIWVVLPLFGTLPFVFGAPLASFTDAFFESMSGFTTTGSTVFTGLDNAPRGMLLWRSVLQWYGGLGIVIVAMVFLPALRVGGMQFFQSEAFDISGEILPRATEVARELIWVYLALTIGCIFAYAAAGMTVFDALCHALATVSTGGFGTRDSGFMLFSPAAHYAGTVFMICAALPFIRFIQLGRGNPRGLWRDTQIRAFLTIVLTVSGAMSIWLVLRDHHPPLDAIRETLFNVASVITGTGFASDDYFLWGGFPVALFLILPLIGGCTASTSCSAKVFRYQILLEALHWQLRRIRSPHAVYTMRYQGRPVEPDVVSSVMAFFFAFLVSIGLWAILLSLIGLDFVTALSGSIAVLCNVGPGLGPVIGPSGNFQPLPDAAKWLLSLGMLLGRLEFLSVLVLLSPAFWRR